MDVSYGRSIAWCRVPRGGVVCPPTLLDLLVGVLLIGAVATGSSSAAADEPSLPMTARVVSNHAYLRAGPGGDYYPTERLARGDRVEVWAIDPSGVCAVRPVAGSFSWVRGADVDRRAAVDRAGPDSAADGAVGGVGIVVADGAVARIGSQLNDLRHVAQVRLEAGERVRVIEEVRIAEGRHAGHWLRIEPPPGEFRWAMAADLDLPAQLRAMIPPPVAADEGIRLAAGALPSGDPAPPAEPLRLPDTPAASIPPAQASSPPAGWMPQGSGIFDPLARMIAAPAKTTPLAASGDELADIDLALSLAVVGPPESWDLAPLRDRLRRAAGRAVTMQDRHRADAIDARLSRFESIQGRHATLAAAQAGESNTLRLGGMWSALSAIGSRPVRPGVLPGGKPADGTPDWTPADQMETTGRLATVVSRRPDAPRWAIVDENNQVIAFISPQSSANLAPLVGQEVSVRGARGYMPEYKRPYLVASEARLRVADKRAPAADAARQ